ncbi:MAG TPA: YceH family protein [Capillimicrobium sp.]|nr:YceH family protein [Capillimicrobium sp.]
MEPDAIELRVLGCLIEKQRTTPDAYPLSLNALRLACNQSTNRDPVMQLDEAQIRDALQRLYRRRWTRLAGAGRAAKYRHLLDEALGLADDELALLAVLMLRGPQTPGELNQRASRLHAFGSLAAVQETLDRLVARELVARLERRPGQKEERFAQILGGGDAESAPPAAPAVTAPTPTEGDAVPPAPQPGPEPAAWADSAPAPAVDEARIERLEREVAALRAELDALRDELGA